MDQGQINETREQATPNRDRDRDRNRDRAALANVVRWLELQKKLKNEIEEVTGRTIERCIREEDLEKAAILDGLRRHPPAHFLLPHMVREDVPPDRSVQAKGSELYTAGDGVSRESLGEAHRVQAGAAHGGRGRRGDGRHRKQGDQDDAVRHEEEDMPQNGAGEAPPRVLLHGQSGVGVPAEARNRGGGGGQVGEARVQCSHETAIVSPTVPQLGSP
ncbi:hypothetical protein BHM03_00024092 [Ensete ventricosum]|nr:hypothetical protein BHM03_00024092 [Ensete ventricosum]